MANLRLFNAPADRDLRLDGARLLDDHVDLLAVPARFVQLDLPAEGGDLVGEPRGSTVSSRARAAPATRRPFVALLKWLTTLRRVPTCWSTRTVATRRRGRGRVARTRRTCSTGDPRSGRCRLPRGRPGRARRASARRRPQAGEVDPAGEPVRRDPVSRLTSPNSDDVIASVPEARRRARRCRGTGGRGPRRARRCRSRRRGRWASRTAARCGVRRRPGSVPARVPGRQVRLLRHTARSAREHLLARFRESGEAELGHGQGLASLRCRLAFRGRQQDQHRASLGRALSPMHRVAPCGPVPQSPTERGFGGFAGAAGHGRERRGPPRRDCGDPAGAGAPGGVPGRRGERPPKRLCGRPGCRSVTSPISTS